MYQRAFRKWSVAVIAALVAGALASRGAWASTPITRGDAEAVVEAFGDGGWAVILHNQEVQLGPGDRAAAIRPLSQFNGRHYCALDWHTIVVSDFEGGDSNADAYRQAVAIISGLQVATFLDGTQLVLTQTAVKRFLNEQLLENIGLQVGYYSQWGRVMAASDLEVGLHSLRIVITDASGVAFDRAITFTVDPAGAGACL
jgi:hypothetical protein